MAKKAVVNRDLKRRVTVKKYAKKRAELQASIANMKLSDEDRLAARHKLQQLPRDASPTRLRNRCKLTGRPRGGGRVGHRRREDPQREVPVHRPNREATARSLAS